MKIIFMFMTMFFLPGLLFAGVYKCANSSGHVVYQSTACVNGEKLELGAGFYQPSGETAMKAKKRSQDLALGRAKEIYNIYHEYWYKRLNMADSEGSIQLARVALKLLGKSTAMQVYNDQYAWNKLEVVTTREEFLQAITLIEEGLN